MAHMTNYHGLIISYTIGNVYSYNNKLGSSVRLIGVDAKAERFLFENNHCCTDNVFIDLIDTSTGLPVIKSCARQLTLF